MGFHILESTKVMAPQPKKVTDLSNELILKVVSNLRGPDKVCCALSNHLLYDVIKPHIKEKGFERLADLCPKPNKSLLTLSGDSRFEELMRRLILWMPQIELRNTLMNTKQGLRALRSISEWPNKGFATSSQRDVALKMVKWQAQFEDKYKEAVDIMNLKVNIAEDKYDLEVERRKFRKQFER